MTKVCPYGSFLEARIRREASRRAHDPLPTVVAWQQHAAQALRMAGSNAPIITRAYAQDLFRLPRREA
jgi:hypothetical protein